MDVRVRVLNVGHGDCLTVVIDQADGPPFSLLIDGGGDGSDIVEKLREYGELPENGEKTVIDLMVATHHDRDHLAGLVEVVESGAFEIRHAWAPVVLKPDLDPLFPMEDELTFTEAAIEDPDGAERSALGRIEKALSRNPFSRDFDNDRLRGLAEKTRSFGLEGIDKASKSVRQTLGDSVSDEFPFLRRLTDVGAQLPQVVGCGGVGLPKSSLSALDRHGLPENPYVAWAAILDEAWQPLPWRHLRLEEEYLATLTFSLTRAAYNVALTAKFIRACKTRGIPISMPLVPNGSASKTQLPGVPTPVQIDLLSPSKRLIERLKDKLVMPPHMLFLARAVNYVTPSNKASYVFNITCDESVALFTGDSGFTDFKFNRQFDQARLQELARAQWVKVPHHGGHFEFFAQCVEELLNQGNPPAAMTYVTSLGDQYTNPSIEFEELANKLHSLTPSLEFHFTNRPDLSRFDDVCAGCVSDRTGPAYLAYKSTGDGSWELENQDELTCCTNLK